MATEDAVTQAAEQPQAEATKAATPESAAPTAAAPASQPSDAPIKKKNKQPGKSPRIGKKLRKVLKTSDEKVRSLGAVTIKQGVAEIKKLKAARAALRPKRKGFNETVEIHVNLGIDSTQSDQMVRGSISLPHGIGKTVRVVVFCQGEKVAAAKAAGADFAGGADLVEKVQKENFLDFDVAIATQDMMGQVSRLGKILGPRNLMPTPKAGTVVPASADVSAVVKEFKAGKVEYRSDKTGQIHAGVGKMSFDDQQIVDNVNTFLEAIRAAKPSGVKGNFINGIVLSATMCPGVRVSA